MEERSERGNLPFANDACFFPVHFRIVTLDSDFVPVNDKVSVLLGRREGNGVGQTERIGERRDSFQGCEEGRPSEVQSAGRN